MSSSLNVILYSAELLVGVHFLLQWFPSRLQKWYIASALLVDTLGTGFLCAYVYLVRSCPIQYSSPSFELSSQFIVSGPLSSGKSHPSHYVNLKLY